MLYRVYWQNALKRDVFLSSVGYRIESFDSFTSTKHRIGGIFLQVDRCGDAILQMHTCMYFSPLRYLVTKEAYYTYGYRGVIRGRFHG